MDYLLENCTYDNSQSIQFLFQCLASFDVGHQRLFLKFVTGMTGLPFGKGLRDLSPPLAKLKCNYPDSSLPMASTCFNCLFLPEYSLNITRQKLVYVICE